MRDQTKQPGQLQQGRRAAFNWRIVMAPMPLVDDVVVHELCHLSGASQHDARFWAAVAGVLPDWEQRRALLRRRGAEFKLD